MLRPTDAERRTTAFRVPTHLHLVRFLGRPEPDEESDEDQQRIVGEAQDPEQDRHTLADRGGHLGGTGVIESQRQRGAEDPAAVHRERRQQVEDRQRHVDPEEPIKETTADLKRLAERRQSPPQSQHEIDNDGEHHVDRRPCERHHQLLSGVPGHPFQSGHSADRQEHDVPGTNSIAPGGQRVSQFVQDHDPEQDQDENQAADRLDRVAVGLVVPEGLPPQEEEEREVDIDVDGGDAAELPGPAHGHPSFLDREGVLLNANLPDLGGAQARSRRGEPCLRPIEVAEPRVAGQRLPVHAIECVFDQKDLDAGQRVPGDRVDRDDLPDKPAQPVRGARVLGRRVSPGRGKVRIEIDQPGEPIRDPTCHKRRG